MYLLVSRDRTNDIKFVYFIFYVKRRGFRSNLSDFKSFPSCAVRYAWISTKNQSKNWMKYFSLQTLCVQKNKLQCYRNRLKIAFAIGTIIMFIHHIGLFLNHRFIFVFLSLSICCDFNLAWNESHANENHFRTYLLNSICCLRYVDNYMAWVWHC